MKRFQNILASVDTRSQTHPALEWAATVAEQNRARLKLVDVLPDFAWPLRLSVPDYDHVRQTLLQEKRERLEALAAPLRAKGLTIATQALSGKTSVEIIREVLRDGHDLVVRVAKGLESRQRRFFGTTTFRLFRKCPCPVWAVRPDSHPSFQKVLAAVDPAPQDEEHAALNRTVIELARSIAKQQGGALHVLHVWSLFGESALAAHMPEDEFRRLMAASQKEVKQRYHDFLAQFDLDLRDGRIHLVRGEPSRTIPEFVQTAEIELVVMGTVARTGVAGALMGNIAEAVLERVQCAVLAVKPEGFVSPVKLPDA